MIKRIKAFWVVLTVPRSSWLCRSFRRTQWISYSRWHSTLVTICWWWLLLYCYFFWGRGPELRSTVSCTKVLQSCCSAALFCSSAFRGICWWMLTPNHLKMSLTSRILPGPQGRYSHRVSHCLFTWWCWKWWSYEIGLNSYYRSLHLSSSEQSNALQSLLPIAMSSKG